jgi:AcrR family transcriptional regulator
MVGRATLFPMKRNGFVSSSDGGHSSMTPSETTTRPRVEGERESAILVAALEVLGEVGYDRLTMDAVAKQAQASKATLYRRWSTKAALVIEAMQHGHSGQSHHPTDVDTGSLRGDLVATFCAVGGLTDKPELDGFTAILTAITTDPEFAARFRSDVLAPKLAANRAIFERAQARGEIGAGVDLDLLVPALPGIVLNRFFIEGEPPTPDVVVRVIDQIILPAAHAAG